MEFLTYCYHSTNVPMLPLQSNTIFNFWEFSTVFIFYFFYVNMLGGGGRHGCLLATISLLRYVTLGKEGLRWLRCRTRLASWRGCSSTTSSRRESRFRSVHALSVFSFFGLFVYLIFFFFFLSCFLTCSFIFLFLFIFCYFFFFYWYIYTVYFNLFIFSFVFLLSCFLVCNFIFLFLFIFRYFFVCYWYFWLFYFFVPFLCSLLFVYLLILYCFIGCIFSSFFSSFFVFFCSFFLRMFSQQLAYPWKYYTSMIVRIHIHTSISTQVVLVKNEGVLLNTMLWKLVWYCWKSVQNYGTLFNALVSSCVRSAIPSCEPLKTVVWALPFQGATYDVPLEGQFNIFFFFINSKIWNLCSIFLKERNKDIERKMKTFFAPQPEVFKKYI